MKPLPCVGRPMARRGYAGWFSPSCSPPSQPPLPALRHKAGYGRPEAQSGDDVWLRSGISEETSCPSSWQVRSPRANRVIWTTLNAYQAGSALLVDPPTLASREISVSGCRASRPRRAPTRIRMVLPTKLISALRPGGSPSMHPPRPRTSRRAAESVSRPFPQSPSASTATIPR
jgi:hypothetical protein